MDFASFQKKRREIDEARARRLKRLLRVQSALGLAVALPLSIWLYGLFFSGAWNTSAVQILLLFLLPFMVVSHRRHVHWPLVWKKEDERDGVNEQRAVLATQEAWQKIERGEHHAFHKSGPPRS
ncbi:hypothetical protein MK280_17185 [Myxococcota bacterium]|nr:hypothetical protein [Myxococcota bacterium]